MRKNKLGEYIKKWRKELNLSQQQLADEAELARSYISRLEDNQFISPSAMVLIKLANALKVSHESLFQVAGYVPHMENTEIPAFDVYMRTKYPGLPMDTIRELERYISFREQESKKHVAKNSK